MGPYNLHVKRPIQIDLKYKCFFFIKILSAFDTIIFLPYSDCSNFASDILCLEIDFLSTSSRVNSKNFCSPFYSWHWAGRPISSTSDGRLRSTHTCGSTHRCFCSAMTWKMMMTLMIMIMVMVSMMMMVVVSDQPILVVQLVVAFVQQWPGRWWWPWWWWS